MSNRLDKEPDIEDKSAWMNWYSLFNHEADMFKAHIAWENRRMIKMKQCNFCGQIYHLPTCPNFVERNSHYKQSPGSILLDFEMSVVAYHRDPNPDRLKIMEQNRAEVLKVMEGK